MTAPEITVMFVFSRGADGSVVLCWNPAAMEMDELFQLLWAAAGVFPQRAIGVAKLTMPDQGEQS